MFSQAALKAAQFFFSILTIIRILLETNFPSGLNGWLQNIFMGRFLSSSPSEAASRILRLELSWRRTFKILWDLAVPSPNPGGIIALSLQSKQMDNTPISGERFGEFGGAPFQDWLMHKRSSFACPRTSQNDTINMRNSISDTMHTS